MSREKQIEEIETIAKTLCADFQTEKCYECPANKHCEVGLDSCVIYDAGYRKQSDGCDFCKEGNEKCGTCVKFFDYHEDGGSDRCSSEYGNEKCAYYKPVHHCSNCGAKMLDKQSEDATDTNVGGKSEWISVDERLPSEEEQRDEYGELVPFLVCEKDTTYPYRAFYDGTEWGDGLMKIRGITHWMPLPQPPKMKGDSHTEQWTFTILDDNGLPESFTKTVKKGGAEE